MKKVLIISASPRKGGNSDLLCDEFARGAREAGHEVGPPHAATIVAGANHSFHANRMAAPVQVSIGSSAAPTGIS